VLRGDERDAEGPFDVRLPPVEFDDARETGAGEERADVARHDVERRLSPLPRRAILEGAEGRQVEVVVVGVRDRDDVERREVGDRDAGGSEPAARPHALGPHRVRGEELAAEALHERGMADPREVRRHRAERTPVVRAARGDERRSRGGAARELPAEEVAEPFVGGGAVEVRVERA
jgi:hypothetical protein